MFFFFEKGRYTSRQDKGGIIWTPLQHIRQRGGDGFSSQSCWRANLWGEAATWEYKNSGHAWLICYKCNETWTPLLHLPVLFCLEKHQSCVLHKGLMGDLTHLKLLVSLREVCSLGQARRCWMYYLRRVPLFNFGETISFSLGIWMSNRVSLVFSCDCHVWFISLLILWAKFYWLLWYHSPFRSITVRLEAQRTGWQ